MKSFRVLDDNIMLRLNETNTHAEAACASFFNELVAAYQKRDASIKFCLEVLTKNYLDLQGCYHFCAEAGTIKVVN